MKCPHCLVEINPDFREINLGKDSQADWFIFSMQCPNTDCEKLIIDLASGESEYFIGGIARLTKTNQRQTVYPFTTSRAPVPPEVDAVFAKDYTEACLVYNLSPKASAALSRRCLQNILQEKAGVKKGNLANEIQEVIARNVIPSYLAESIDAVRNIGNFAAHPTKSSSTGEIVEVEVGEAEWLLDVLELLFDFYFVQPAKNKQKRDALNQKLADAGKPPMK